jgi:hypothetical protein
MRSDSSLDHEIHTLERRIRDRRVALHESVADVRQAAAAAKTQIRERATSPLVWGAALVIGFVIARVARRRPQPMHATLRFGRGEPPPRKPPLGAVLSLLLPIALRIAQHSLVPLIARTLQAHARRRAYAR